MNTDKPDYTQSADQKGTGLGWMENTAVGFG